MVTIHAVALLLVVSSPAILWLMRRSERDATHPSFLENIVYVGPFLIVGGICSALLSINGFPLSEWAIPAFVVVAAGLIAPSASAMRMFSVIVFFVCIALCAEGLWLRESGYTSNPTMTSSFSAARSKALLSSIRDKVENQQLPP